MPKTAGARPPPWLEAQLSILEKHQTPRLGVQWLRSGGCSQREPALLDRFSLRVPFCLGALLCESYSALCLLTLCRNCVTTSPYLKSHHAGAFGPGSSVESSQSRPGSLQLPLFCAARDSDAATRSPPGSGQGRPSPSVPADAL